MADNNDPTREIVGEWRKSSRSNTLSNVNCVMLAPTADGGVAVHDSKAGVAGGVMYFSREEMAACFAGVKDGEFDDLVSSQA